MGDRWTALSFNQERHLIAEEVTGAFHGRPITGARFPMVFRVDCTVDPNPFTHLM
jgi:hypothetical protein